MVGGGADYTVWAANYPGFALTNPNLDLDGDGYTKGAERLFGINPTAGSSANPVSVPLSAATGTFSYTRRNPALTGFTYEVWTSPNLQTWFEDTGAIQAPGTPNANGVQTVAVTLSPALLTAPKLFMQVRAAP